MLYFWPGGASKTGDYSEQQLVDCGFGHEADADNKGCKGAWPHGYVKWMLNKKQNLASEADYPYKEVRETCQSSKKYNQGLIDSNDASSSTYLFAMLHQGAHLTGGHWTRKGDESLLKKLVAQHGAVVTTVAVHGSFMPYKGGIYQGCTNEETNHSVVVVGYGTENGVDYWLIKVGGIEHGYLATRALCICI